MGGETETPWEVPFGELAEFSLSKASSGFYWVTPEGRFVNTNETFQEKLGYSEGKLKEMYIWDIASNFSEEDREEFWNKLKEEKTWIHESKYETKDGEVFPVEITSHFIEYGDGEYFEFAFVKDITEHGKIKEKLEEKDRQLGTLLENLPGMAYRCLNNKNYTMKFVSERGEEVTGYSSEELIDDNELPFGELIVPEDREKVWKEIQEGLEKGEYFQPTYRIETKNGQKRWVWERGKGILDEEGEVKFLEGFIHDITERKRSEERLKAFVDAIPDLVVVLDEEGCYEEVLTSQNDLLYESREELLGKRADEVLPKDTGNRMLDFVQETIESDEVQKMEYSLNLDGDKHWFEGRALPLQREEESSEHVVSVIRDISEQKRLRDRKDFLNTLLRQDLGSKFRIIQGYLQMIDGEADLPEELGEYLGKSIELSVEANDILRLAKDLEKLEDSGWEGGKDVVKVLGGVIDDISDLIDSERVEVEENFPETLSKVSGDFSLDTLLKQLLVTRIQLGECRKIKIRASEEEDILLKFKDDGKKLPEDAKNLFTGGVYRGETTGIGGVRYYMLEEIARHNNAKIEVEDSELGGARFDVHLQKV